MEKTDAFLRRNTFAYMGMSLLLVRHSSLITIITIIIINDKFFYLFIYLIFTKKKRHARGKRPAITISHFSRTATGPRPSQKCRLLLLIPGNVFRYRVIMIANPSCIDTGGGGGGNRYAVIGMLVTSDF